MRDNYGRPVKSIRISVTEQCNLHCYYCHNEGQPSGDAEMTPGEIEKVLMVAEEMGITKVKFTGGEPLLRKDIVEIVGRACKHMDDISITTNGTLLASMAQDLKEAGLNRINISLDSVCRESYRKITGKDMLDDVLEGVEAAVASGMHPVKVNIVVLSSTSIDELMETIGAVWSMGAMPQLIELVELNGAQYDNIASVEDVIASRAMDVKERNMHKRKIYTLEDGNCGLKDVEVVRPMHNTEFCANCTRIRVTSGGMLKPCLMHNNDLIDILGPIRDQAPEHELSELFRSAVMKREPYWR